MIRMKETTTGFDDALLKGGERYTLKPDQEKYLIQNGKDEAVETDDDGDPVDVAAVTAEATAKWEKVTDKKFREKFPTVESYVKQCLEDAKG